MPNFKQLSLQVHNTVKINKLVRGFLSLKAHVGVVVITTKGPQRMAPDHESFQNPMI